MAKVKQLAGRQRIRNGLLLVSLLLLPITLYNPMFEGSITLQEYWFYMCYIVITVLVLLAVVLGRRAVCHSICWMAPFMILGRKLRNLVGWPALGLRAEKGQCIDCGLCTVECTMSLDVNQMVKDGRMDHSECVLCGNCVDVCPKDVLHYTWSGRALAKER